MRLDLAKLRKVFRAWFDVTFRRGRGRHVLIAAFGSKQRSPAIEIFFVSR